MAGRNLKIGLEYFPMDIDMFSDIKVRKLIKYQSANSIVIYMHLLCNIYRNGYYMKWDEDLPFTISEITGYNEDFIKEVINSTLDIDLFSKSMFEQYKVLTSKGIQKRFQLICDASKRKFKITDFNLISSEEMPIDSELIGNNSEEMPIDSELMQQSKVKKSKVKEKKRKENIDFDAVVELYHQKCPSFPHIIKLSEDRKQKIKNRLTEMKSDFKLLETVFTTMQNSKFLRGENKNGWQATFDWIFENGQNWVKVIEGNYNDKTITNSKNVNEIWN